MPSTPELTMRHPIQPPETGRSRAGRLLCRCLLPLLVIASTALQAANTAPTISNPGDAAIDEDTSTSALPFTVSDAETAAGSLTLLGISSNPGLVPLSGISFGGSGGNRTVTITPAANANGVATITVTVSDGALTADAQFTVTVRAVNDPPTLSALGDVTIDEDTSTGAIALTVGDVDNPANSLSVQAASSNPSLLPVSRIVLGGSGASRTVTLSPAADQNGSATVTLTVSDGQLSAFRTFDLTVRPVADAPRFTGSLPALIGDDQPAQLFTNFTFTSVDDGHPSPVTLTVTLVLPGGESGASMGSFRNNQTNFTGTPAQVTAQVRALYFDPLPNRLPVGQQTNVSVTVLVFDGALASPDNGARSFQIRSVDDPPTLVASTVPSVADDNRTVSPFRLTVNDPDVLDNTFTASVQPLSDPGFSFGTLDPANNSYTGSASVVALGVQGLRFIPVPNHVTNSQPVTFQVVVTDSFGTQAVSTVTLTVRAVADPPEILGVPINDLRITDDATNSYPFQTVQIQDVDENGQQLVTVTLAVDDPAKGTFDPPGPFGNRTPAQATADLRAVRFLPTNNRLADYQTETATLTLRVRDSQSLETVNSGTRVAITGVNGAPKINGLPAQQPALISPLAPIRPFRGLSVTDDDGTNITLTITLDNPAKGTLTNLGGFVEQGTGSGVFRLTAFPAQVTAALTNLAFAVSNAFLFPASAPGGTTFRLEAVDSKLNRAVVNYSIVLQFAPRNHLVTRLDDDWAAGSLRHALTNCENNGVVTFALSQYPARLRLSSTLGPLILTRNVTLKGPGADLLEISGDSNGDFEPDTQIGRVQAAVTLEGLTLARGTAQTGGALYVAPGGALVMRSCAILDCRAVLWGGAIDVEQGSLVLQQCLVRSNVTDQAQGLGGGAISLYTDWDCSFVNSTFSANRQQSLTGFGGGAIYAENFDPISELIVEVTHCTFAENQDTSALGSSISANVFGTLVSVRNSIFADGTSQNLDVQGAGRLASLGGNVSDDNTHAILTQAGQPQLVVLLDQPSDLRQTNALLGPFNPDLKPTGAYPLLRGSPAVGRAVPTWQPTDQRGVIRDVAPDAGAIEYNASARVVLNEIQAKGAVADFVELYVPRDSAPVSLSGYSLWVDGIRRHFFSGGSVLAPGNGIIVADAAIAAAIPNVVVSSETNLNLGQSGLVELRTPLPQNLPVASFSFLDLWADPNAPLLSLPYAGNSLTLDPQFRGFALVPHTWISAALQSPGADTANTAFGASNAVPVAVADSFLVGEDDVVRLPVLANDSDADGSDELFIVDLSNASGLGTGNVGALVTTAGASVRLDPSGTPLRGTSLIYDPRASASLQSLPAGARRTEEFWYEIVDCGTGLITNYAAGAGATTVLSSPAHRLLSGQSVFITNSVNPSYNGPYTITRLNADQFSIPVAFTGQPQVPGSWRAQAPWPPTTRSEAKVTLTVLGANDPPTPGNDTVATDEETILRIMADAVLAGSTTSFDTDALYPLPRRISPVSLLANDSDVDTDDTAGTLKVVAVVGQVHPITGYSPSAENLVLVTSPGHGLGPDSTILISGYGGHPSYNAFHAVTVLDSNSFRLPMPFVDDAAAKGVWTVLTPQTSLTATSALGATVTLEIRADRTETSVVYNPRGSAELQRLGLGAVTNDTFYYGLQDSHQAVSLGRVTVQVTGVDDAPHSVPLPLSLATLAPILNDGHGHSLAQVISNLDIQFWVTPTSGAAGRVDLQARFVDPSESNSVSVLPLPDFWVTDEDTVLRIPAAQVCTNATDIDRGDVLRVQAVPAFSRQGAALAVEAGTGAIVYNPTVSAALNALAREETVVDSFDATIGDGHGGSVSMLLAILVIGRNDAPQPVVDRLDTPEDVLLVYGPPGATLLSNDVDPDVNGHSPDNHLSLIPTTNAVTPGGASMGITGNTFVYDPRRSALLDTLAPGETFVETFLDVVMDDSFLFANDDLFQVSPAGSAYVLPVLANDRSLSGIGLPISGFGGTTGAVPVVVTAPNHGLTNGMAVAIAGYGGSPTYNQVHLVTVVDSNRFSIPVAFVDDHAVKGLWTAFTITGVSDPNAGGTVTVAPGASGLLYTPEPDFVGDETFAYTLTDTLGRSDRAFVTVRVTLDALNGFLVAHPDSFTVARGEAPVLDVLANDNRVAGGASLFITRILSQPARDQVQLSGSGIAYAQLSAGPFPYLETFSYEVSAGGTARGVATVTVRVIDRQGALLVRPDTFAVESGTADNVLDVLANDTILPGSATGLTISRISVLPTNGTARMDTAGTALIYTPNAGYVGLDSLVYVATDGLGGSGTATNYISVGSLTTASDFFAVAYTTNGAIVELDVLANDLILQSSVTSVKIVAVTPTVSTLGNMAIKSDGSRLLFGPTTLSSGEQSFTYTLRDPSGRTAQGRATVVVFQEGVRANADYYTVGTGSSANLLPVLANDLAIPQGARPVTIISLGSGTEAPNQGGTVEISLDGSYLVYAPAAGFSGEETFTYTMTDSRSVDTARVVVRVTSGQLSANDDAFTVFYEAPAAGAAPRTFTLPVLANDRVLPDLGQTLTITGVGINDPNATNAPNRQGAVSVSGDGRSLVFEPRATNGPFPYVERFTYEITDGSARRAQAVVLVEVQQRANVRSLEVNPDSFAVAADSSVNLLPVLINDGVKPASASDWSVTALTTPAHGAAAVVGTQVFYAPAPGFLGTDSFSYTVSDGFGGTGSAQITVKVGALRARNDLFTVLSGSAPTVLDVLANDPLQPDTTTARPIVAVGTPNHGGSASVWPGGTAVLYAPAPGFSGQETFTYAVADDSGTLLTAQVVVEVVLAGSDRTTSTVVVTVHGVNDPPVPAPDVAQGAQNTSICLNAAALVANDFDVESDRLTLAGVIPASAAGGTAVLSGGLVYYTPPLDFLGTDTVTTVTIDEHGGTGSTNLQITVETALAQKMTAPILNITNGYFNQTVRVINPLTNNACGVMPAVQVLCTNLPSGARVINANGTNAGRPFVTSNVALAPGQSADLVIVFYTTNRVAPTNVVLSTRVVPQTPPAGNSPSPALSRQTMNANGLFTFQFTARPGATYVVQRSTDLRTWHDVGSPLVAPQALIQWRDDSLYLSDGSARWATNCFYRVQPR